MRTRLIARAAAAVAATFLFVGVGVAATAALALVSLSASAGFDPTLVLLVAATPFLFAPLLAGVTGATTRGSAPPAAALAAGLGSLVGTYLLAAAVVGTVVALADAAGTDPVVAVGDLAVPLALAGLPTAVVGAASGYLAARTAGVRDSEPSSRSEDEPSSHSEDEPSSRSAPTPTATEDDRSGSVADLFEDADEVGDE